MNPAPPGGIPRQLRFRNIVAQLESVDGEPIAGVRIIEPDVRARQAMRGKLFVVIDLTGDHPERVRFVEGLLNTIQHTYYNEKGSQSHVLVESVRAARSKVDNWNHRYPDRPLRAGIVSAGFLNGRLMIIHNGPALALVTTGNRVERYPSDALSAALERLPDRPSNWEIYRQEVEESVSLFMGATRWLDRVPIRTLAGTVAHLTMDNCRAAATGLGIEAGSADFPGLLFYAEREDATTIHGSGSARAMPLVGSRRRRHADALSLPTALGAKPPVRDFPPADADGEARRSQSDRTPARPVAAPRQAVEPEQVPADDTSSESGPVMGDERQPVAAVGGAPAIPQHVPVDPDAMAEGEETAMAGAEETGQSVLVVPMPATESTPSAQTGLQSGPSWRAAASAVAVSTTGVFARAKEVMIGMLPDKSTTTAQNPYAYRDQDDGDLQDVRVETLVDDMPRRTFWSDVNARIHDAVRDAEPYAPPPPSRDARARTYLLLAVLILVLAPVLVYGYFYVQNQPTGPEVEGLLAMAQTRYDNGQLALVSGDEDTARAMCLDADGLLQQAIGIAGRNTQTTQLADDIQRCINATMRTRYLYELTEPLVQFVPDAEPHRVIVVDENIFVLDRGRQLVELYRLDGTRSFVPDPLPEVVLREGQSIDSATVGRVVDMAWQPVVAGFQEKASLLLLDRNNQLFRYDPRVEGASFEPMNAESPLQVPNQIEVYLGRAYISDEGANQIFRFDPGQFSGQPQPWFDEQAKTNLSGVVRMVIDGDIWLLYLRGSLVRYAGGTQIPFSLDSGSITPDQPVDMAIGDEVAPYIYIADATRERILVFDKQGVYQFQLLAPEENPLRDLRGVFVEPVANNLYILTKDALYQHPMPQ